MSELAGRAALAAVARGRTADRAGARGDARRADPGGQGRSGAARRTVRPGERGAAGGRGRVDACGERRRDGVGAAADRPAGGAGAYGGSDHRHGDLGQDRSRAAAGGGDPSMRSARRGAGDRALPRALAAEGGAVRRKSEIWPATMVELAKRAIPQVLINGRMSPRSFALAADAGVGAGGVRAAHGGAGAGRGRQIAARGAPRADGLGHRQSQVRRGAARCRCRAGAARGGDVQPRWLAASTHPGEETIAAKAHAIAARRLPGLLTGNRAAPSDAATRPPGDAGGSPPAGGVAIARRDADRRDRRLPLRHDRRDGADLPAGAGGLRRRVAGAARQGRTRSSRRGSASRWCTGRRRTISPRSIASSTRRAGRSRSTIPGVSPRRSS